MKAEPIADEEDDDEYEEDEEEDEEEDDESYEGEEKVPKAVAQPDQQQAMLKTGSSSFNPFRLISSMIHGFLKPL